MPKKWVSKGAGYATVRDYHGAEAFLTLTKGGTAPSRKIANNTYVVRVNPGSGENPGKLPLFGILYHSTIVVTYYPDGTCAIDNGGWDSVTTKARIRWFSPAYLWTDRRTGGYVLGSERIGETPVRSRKCSACIGTGDAGVSRETWENRPQYVYGEEGRPGQWVTDPGAWNRAWSRRNYHNAARISTIVRIPFARRFAAREIELAKGRTFWNPVAAECGKCNGTGQVSIGGRPIYRPVTLPCRIDASGHLIGPAPSHCQWHPPYTPKLSDAIPVQGMTALSSLGLSVEDTLARAIPALRDTTARHRCPTDPGCFTGSIMPLVIHLNDVHKWPREKVADHLDTLDIDLSFSIPESAKGGE